MDKIGLIAGSGPLPVTFAEEAGKNGKNVVAIAFEGYTLAEIEKKARTCWLKTVRVSEVIRILKEEGIAQLAMQGKLPQSMVFAVEKMDSQARAIIEGAGNRSGRAILGKAADLLESMGITVLDARTYLEDILCAEGPLTLRRPNEEERADIGFGIEVFKKIAPAEIGQCIVVRNRVVLAVEAAEGTDEAIRRGARLGDKNVVVVKMAGEGRDMRFDVPVVGLKTLETMSECKAGTLAVEAGRTFLLNREETVGYANERSIAIIGVRT